MVTLSQPMHACWMVRIQVDQSASTGESCRHRQLRVPSIRLHHSPVVKSATRVSTGEHSYFGKTPNCPGGDTVTLPTGGVKIGSPDIAALALYRSSSIVSVIRGIRLSPLAVRLVSPGPFP